MNRCALEKYPGRLNPPSEPKLYRQEAGRITATIPTTSMVLRLVTRYELATRLTMK